MFLPLLSFTIGSDRTIGSRHLMTMSFSGVPDVFFDPGLGDVQFSYE